MSTPPPDARGLGSITPMILRSAKPADADAVARVHVRSWQVAYRGLLPDEYLDGLRPEDRAERYAFGELSADAPSTIVAVEREDICGFATTGPCNDDDRPGTGELYALCVDPDYWGTGIGRALMTAARETLVRQAFAAASLWVLVGNRRAERFYRIDGWEPDGCGRVADVWGVTVDEIRYCRSLPSVKR